MIRTLVLIAIVGFLVSIVCFGAVGAMGGIGWNRDWDWDHSHVIRTDDGEWRGHTKREIAWKGASSLEIDVPANVRYLQGDQLKLEIAGPERAVRAIRVEGGHISAPGLDWAHWVRARKLDITITAPAVSSFTLNGAQELNIDGYRQDSIRIEINGSGDVKGRGEARQLDLQISGAGDVDLGDLAVTDAKVEIAGSGDAIVAPTGLADIEIAGSGDVTLASRPAKLVTEIAGSGDIRQQGGETIEKDDIDEKTAG